MVAARLEVRHTTMYNESMDWKLATIVVMKGCPATLARTLRSFRTCSTCLRRMTVDALAAAATLLVDKTHRRPCVGSSGQRPDLGRPALRSSVAPAIRAQRCLTAVSDYIPTMPCVNAHQCPGS